MLQTVCVKSVVSLVRAVACATNLLVKTGSTHAVRNWPQRFRCDEAVRSIRRDSYADSLKDAFEHGSVRFKSDQGLRNRPQCLMAEYTVFQCHTVSFNSM